MTTTSTANAESIASAETKPLKTANDMAANPTTHPGLKQPRHQRRQNIALAQAIGGQSPQNSRTYPQPRQPVTLTGEQADRLHNMILGMGLLLRNAGGRALTAEERNTAEIEICWALDYFNARDGVVGG